jgi:hypothetical protein
VLVEALDRFGGRSIALQRFGPRQGFELGQQEFEFVLL